LRLLLDPDAVLDDDWVEQMTAIALHGVQR